MTELVTIQAFVVIHEGLKIPRAVFLDREMAQEFVDGDQAQKSIIEPVNLVIKKGVQQLDVIDYIDEFEKWLRLADEWEDSVSNLVQDGIKKLEDLKKQVISQG